MNKLDKLAKKYAKNNEFKINNTYLIFKSGAKEVVNLIDWDKILDNLANSDLCSTEIIEEDLGDINSNLWLNDCSTIDILEFFKKQIENQIKKL